MAGHLYDEAALRREMLQARILAGVFGEAVGRRFRQHIALKGGLAMRLLHGGERMTKDVDLESDGTFPVEAARRWMSGAMLRAARSLGIQDARVSEPKQTETTQRWKMVYAFPGGMESHLTVEMSRRGLPSEDLLTEAPVGGPEGLPVLARTYTREAIAVAKLGALPRTAPRDVYDLHLLIVAEVRPGAALVARLGMEHLLRLSRELWGLMEAMPFARASDELLPYLPREVRARFTEARWEQMKLEVASEVQDWVERGMACP